MKLNNIILGEISQTEKTNTVRLQISEVLGVSTLTETERRMLAPRRRGGEDFSSMDFNELRISLFVP
jgi:hypothetical protein